MKLLLFVWIATLAWGQDSTGPLANVQPVKHEPTPSELQAENAALRSYIAKLQQWYSNSITVIKVEHDAVVNACTGPAPQEPKPEAK